MAIATRKRPAKPHADYPLFPHRNGQWCKKVRGKHRFFGVWDNPDSALAKWLDQKDDLLAGRTPRVSGGELTVKELCERFVSAKRDLVDSGELALRTWGEYHAGCLRLIRAPGADRLVCDLASDDFEQLRSGLTKTMGPVSLRCEVQRIRSLFKYGFDSGLIDRPVRFGSQFRAPSARVILNARQEKGLMMFESDEIHRILDVAKPQIKAMTLLGANAAFGNHDCSSLPKTALDLDAGWVTYPRPKTGIGRRCPLWPETADAIRTALDTHPEPKDPLDANLVFLTAYGRRWVRLNGKVWLDSLSGTFGRIQAELGLKRKGRGFYALRHSFRTVADEVRDRPAIDFIMGHKDPSMAGSYRERIDDSRLVAVTDHVRRWLFDGKESK